MFTLVAIWLSVMQRLQMNLFITNAFKDLQSTHTEFTALTMLAYCLSHDGQEEDIFFD